jgi:hypothetical protein
VDQFAGTQWTAEDPVEPVYEEVIRKIPIGLTHFALHATKPEAEIISFAPDHRARTREYEVLAKGVIARGCAQNRVALAGYRDLQAR